MSQQHDTESVQETETPGCIAGGDALTPASRLAASSPFGREMAGVAVANALIAVLGFCTGILSARLLGQRGRGELAAIQTWPNFISLVAVMGTHEAAVYYGATDPSRARTYAASALALALIADVPLVIAGYFAMPLLLSAQNPTIIFAARVYLLFPFLLDCYGIPAVSLRAVRAFGPWNQIRIAPGLGLVGVLLLAWLTGFITPVFIASGILAFNIVLIAQTLLLVSRHVDGRFVPDRSFWRPLLTYGLPCVFASMPQMLNFRLDQMLMTSIVAPSELGLYVVAVAWSGASAPLLGAISAVVFPRIASEPDPRERSRIFAYTIRNSLVMAVLLSILVFVATPWAVPLLFGRSFAGSIPSALLLVPAAGVSAFNLILEEGIRGLGDPVAVTWSEFGGLLVTAILLAALLRPFGIVGAAIASLCAYSAISVLLLFQVRALTALGFTDLLMPSPEELVEELDRVRTTIRTAL
jgi:O-antigen/teichoic acid export membrane protein